MTTYYKLLNEDGTTPQGYGTWFLPKRQGRLGKWMPAIRGKLIGCRNGYHVLKTADLLEWYGPVLWELEIRGNPVRSKGDNKTIVRQARLIRKVEEWNDQTLRMVAADFAERGLLIFEAQNPADGRVRKTIGVIRAYARGEATKRELDAARDAARDVLETSSAAARVAAYAAVYATTRIAARDATEAAARRAWAAARAVRAAAWAAAEDDAEDDAGAARAAERRWQQKRLKQYLEGKAV